MLWFFLPVLWTVYRGVMYQVKFVSLLVLSALSLFLYGITALTWNTILPWLWGKIKKVYFEFPLELKVAINVLLLLVVYEQRAWVMSTIQLSGRVYTPAVPGYIHWVGQRMWAVVAEAWAEAAGTAGVGTSSAAVAADTVGAAGAD